MRLLKLVLAAALVAGLWIMWTERGQVVSAYTEPPEPVDVRLDGLDLAFRQAEVDPSPFAVADPPDLRAASAGAVLAPAPPEPASPTIGPGTSRIGGLVTDGVAPVVGAIVRIERHTTAGIDTTELLTLEDGTWELPGIVGGRYRVRSFVPSSITSGPADVFFLPVSAERTIDHVLTGAPAPPVLMLVGPDEMTVGVPATAAVTVATRIVDVEGRIASLPVAAAPVTASVGTPFTILSERSVFADAGGASRFLLSCDLAGTGVATVSTVVLGVPATASLALPPCVDPPPPEPEPGEESDAAEADE